VNFFAEFADCDNFRDINLGTRRRTNSVTTAFFFVDVGLTVATLSASVAKLNHFKA
jgi:hypothetical protein